MEPDLEWEKFESARKQFFKYIKAHPYCTRAEIIRALQWPVAKVDAFLQYALDIKLLELSKSPIGEPTYRELDIINWQNELLKKIKQNMMEEEVQKKYQRGKTSPKPEDSTRLWGENSDIFEYLSENNLL